MNFVEKITNVEKQISSIADFNWVLNIENLKAKLSDEELANSIKGATFPKVKQKIEDFVERSNEMLLNLELELSSRKKELTDAEQQVRATDPGSKPSKPYGNDLAAIDRYNQKVQEFNNRLDLNRRMRDQAIRLKERYEDHKMKYEEKSADLKEQIIAKEEELKPAFDKDLSLLFSKLGQITTESLRANNCIEGFMLGYLSKKTIVNLKDRLYDSFEEQRASEVASKIDNEIDLQIKTNESLMKDGISSIFHFLHTGFNNNLQIAKSIESDLEKLPEHEYKLYGDTIERVLRVDINTNIIYKDIIDPNKLNDIAIKIKSDTEQFSDGISKIDEYKDKLLPVYSQIAITNNIVMEKLGQIEQNNNINFKSNYALVHNVLGAFDDDNQDAYLPKCKNWIENLQGEIEQRSGASLKELLRAMVETQMLAGSTKKMLADNKVLGFLETQNQLDGKRRAFEKALPTLNMILEDLDKQPKDQALQFTKETTTLFNISFIPFGNLISSFLLHQKFGKYSVAIQSGNQYYNESKSILFGKIKTTSVVHFVISAIFIGLGIVISPILITIGVTYAISGLYLISQKSKFSTT